MTTVELVLGALTLIVGSGAFATWVGKMVPQRESAAKKRSDRIAELESARSKDREEQQDTQRQVDDVRADLRVLTDYVHDLREHIDLRKPPPPPDWPEGLRH